MREIKCRGKNKDIGWVYGQLVYDVNRNTYIVEEVEMDTSYGLEENILFATMWYRVEKETIGQYTGIKDKNGKEICEGDIVKRSLIDKKDNHIFFEDIYQIIFEQSAFKYKGIKQYYIDKKGGRWKGEQIQDYTQDLGSNFGVDIKEIEVIGNIHDNPKLLEA